LDRAVSSTPHSTNWEEVPTRICEFYLRLDDIGGYRAYTSSETTCLKDWAHKKVNQRQTI
jgi:hypothetical protein